ncbi:hypothetical protein [Dyadobacter helix]|uniref:hypothetical protein n=1 Tax=Dyadobacter helix TaxID=2822344 RepID=UPI001E54DBDC|nr:hypothetical protein [Dyadobacter sp. CECT 9275]
MYTNLAAHEKAILDYCEKNDLSLNAITSQSLTSKDTWQKQLDLLNNATDLLAGNGYSRI